MLGVADLKTNNFVYRVEPLHPSTRSSGFVVRRYWRHAPELKETLSYMGGFPILFEGQQTAIASACWAIRWSHYPYDANHSHYASIKWKQEPGPEGAVWAIQFGKSAVQGP